jgi:putative ABC transport system permease protein
VGPADLNLAVRNATRNRRRTVLTVLSLAVPFTVLVALQATLDSMDAWLDRSGSHVRAVVHHRLGPSFDLPVHYGEKLARLPGVEAACSASGFLGTMGTSREMVFATAIDVESFRRVWREWSLAPRERDAFAADRSGCVMDPEMTRRLGLRPGDAITLHGALHPVELKLTLRGVLVGWPDPYGFFFHQRMLEEATGSHGRTTDFWLLVRGNAHLPAVQRAAEELFANSAHEVRAVPEKAFMEMFLSMGGNIRAMVSAVGLAVVALIMLVAANSIAMSVRERTCEVALMKALGFPPSRILALVMMESALLGLAAGLIGCGVGWWQIGCDVGRRHLVPAPDATRGRDPMDLAGAARGRGRGAGAGRPRRTPRRRAGAAAHRLKPRRKRGRVPAPPGPSACSHRARGGGMIDGRRVPAPAPARRPAVRSRGRSPCSVRIRSGRPVTASGRSWSSAAGSRRRTSRARSICSGPRASSAWARSSGAWAASARSSSLGRSPSSTSSNTSTWRSSRRAGT